MCSSCMLTSKSSYFSNLELMILIKLRFFSMLSSILHRPPCTFWLSHCRNKILFSILIPHLRPGRQVDEPQLGVCGRLCLADECVRGGPQEVAAGERAEGPAAGEVVADADLELGRLVPLVLEEEKKTSFMYIWTRTDFVQWPAALTRCIK